MQLFIQNKRVIMLTLTALLVAVGGFFTWRELTMSENVRFLNDKMSRHNGRYYTFLRAMDLMDQRAAKVLVETGTARCGLKDAKGDGASTVVFGQWAQKHDTILYSVDIDPQSIQNAAADLGDCRDHVKLVLGDSVEFLARFKEPIDFLYLDSYDYDEQDPEPSQEHHLKEVLAVMPRLHDKSIILIDDCKLKGGGNGKLVIAYLLQHGWKVDRNAYQVLLVKR